MKWLSWLICFLVLPAAVLAADPVRVEIEEVGKITSYLDTYWVVQVNGTGTVHNPSDSDLFDVRLFFDILGLDILDLGGDAVIDQNSLSFRRIPAFSSRDFSYQIIGITTEPPTLRDRGVLYTGLSKRTTRIYSDIFGELQKAPLEDAQVTGRDGRLISVTLQNPTTLQYTIESLRVLKTPLLDPNQILDEWQVVDPQSPRILEANGFFVHDILDVQSAEGLVYWLESEVFISRVDLLDNSTLDRFTEEDLLVPIEELNFTEQVLNRTSEFITSDYAIRKRISESVAVPGQPVTVLLILYNFGERLQRYSVEDTLPTGFSTPSSLRWEGELPARNSVVLSYEATLEDTETIGFDVFPRATMRADGRTFFSQEIPFLRQFLPDERVFVQKRVSVRDDDLVRITLRVQNLGRNTLRGATLVEFLDDHHLFSEITELPAARGEWEVPALGPQETWEVSYVTEESDLLTRLPSLYGVSSASVLRSIVVDNIVREGWVFARQSRVELFGFALLVLLPTLYVVGRKQNWF